MTVTVLLFASYAEALGAPTIEVEIPADARVADLVGALHSRVGAGRLPPRPLVAVNQRYASLEQTLRAGDEVAVIPPVAGG